MAYVNWLWPSSVKSTSSMVLFPQRGQMIGFSKSGRIVCSLIPIFPISQSNSFRHFLHSKLIFISSLPVPQRHDGIRSSLQSIETSLYSFTTKRPNYDVEGKVAAVRAVEESQNRWINGVCHARRVLTHFYADRECRLRFAPLR